MCSKGGGPTACAGVCSKFPSVREKSKGGRRKREHEGLRVRESIPEEVTLEHRLEGDDPAVRERGSGRWGGVHPGTKPRVLKEGQDARVDGDSHCYSGFGDLPPGSHAFV